MNTISMLPERRRVRQKIMAAELQVSVRRFRDFVIMGCPYTAIGKTLWFEPALVHAWLDKYNRKGSAGVKRTKGVRATQPAEAH
jgi:hypothetical protein